jgi:amino acid transporter
VVVQYWAPDLNPAIVITIGLIGLIAANGFSARVYGEVGTPLVLVSCARLTIEFWISILKVLLMLGLFLYTFITMLGGNPIKDRYGFR